MKPILNSVSSNHPIDSCPVFYDSYGQKFFTIKDGQLLEILQEQSEELSEHEYDTIKTLIYQLPIGNILEMVKDWEREKYPERFL